MDWGSFHFCIFFLALYYFSVISALYSGCMLFGDYMFIIVTVSFWVLSFSITKCSFSNLFVGWNPTLSDNKVIILLYFPFPLPGTSFLGCSSLPPSLLTWFLQQVLLQSNGYCFLMLLFKGVLYLREREYFPWGFVRSQHLVCLPAISWTKCLYVSFRLIFTVYFFQESLLFLE